MVRICTLGLALLLALAACAPASSPEGARPDTPVPTPTSSATPPETQAGGMDMPASQPTHRRILVSFWEQTYAATLEDNTSAQAFVQLLEEQGGSLTIPCQDYGGFEKVGSLPTSLPRNDTQITTAPGDLILYQGNQITLYYDRNRWSFTRLGRLEGDLSQLEAQLGSGDVALTFSLPAA